MGYSEIKRIKYNETNLNVAFSSIFVIKPNEKTLAEPVFVLAGDFYNVYDYNNYYHDDSNDNDNTNSPHVNGTAK